MNRDRLNELRGGNGSPRNNNPYKYQYNQINESSYEMSSRNNNDNEFMNKVKELEQMLSDGKNNVDKIKRLYAKSLVNVNQSEANRNHQILEDIRSETSVIFKRVGNAIKAIDNETKRLGNNKETPIRKAQVSKLSKDLKNALSEYTDVQREFKEKYRERMRRQYRVVNSNASEEEIERALDNPNAQIFSQGLTMSVANSQSALREAREKHDDIKKIEQSINELCTLFQDMETLLMTQNETIVNIENNIYQTENDVDEASKQMTQAIEIRKNSRKTLWIITAILAVVIIGLLLYFGAPIINFISSIAGGDDDSNANANNGDANANANTNA